MRDVEDDAAAGASGDGLAEAVDVLPPAGNPGIGFVALAILFHFTMNEKPVPAILFQALSRCRCRRWC